MKLGLKNEVSQGQSSHVAASPRFQQVPSIVFHVDQSVAHKQLNCQYHMVHLLKRKFIFHPLILRGENACFREGQGFLKKHDSTYIQWIILVGIIYPPRRQYIPGIYAVYTANWVIIYYLPPFTRTRKIH